MSHHYQSAAVAATPLYSSSPAGGATSMVPLVEKSDLTITMYTPSNSLHQLSGGSPSGVNGSVSHNPMMIQHHHTQQQQIGEESDDQNETGGGGGVSAMTSGNPVEGSNNDHGMSDGIRGGGQGNSGGDNLGVWRPY
jgi:hypothetical protein